MARAYMHQLMMCLPDGRSRLCSHASLKWLGSDLYLLTSWPRSLTRLSGLSTRSGMGIRVFKCEFVLYVVLWFVRVEHYSYTPHPKDFSLPIPRFACAFWVMRFTRFSQPLRSCYQVLPTVTLCYLGDLVLPNNYLLLPPSCMWWHGQLGWIGFELGRLTNCYQTLPWCRSGSTPREPHLYQAPPPALDITHSTETMCYVML